MTANTASIAPVKDNTPIKDPRADWPPHLRYNDSLLWSRLLTLAYQKNRQLALTLEGFRIVGTRIEKMSNGKFVLRPIIGGMEAGLPGGWKDKQNYKVFANRYLRPHHDMLVELLEELGKEALGKGHIDLRLGGE